MPELKILPDNKVVEVENDTLILQASLDENVSHAHACGAMGICTTCRVLVIDGLDNCSKPTENEIRLKNKIHSNQEFRLACQTKVQGDMTVRRLVLDNEDINLTSQINVKEVGRLGETKKLAILFCDIRGFTPFAEKITPYDTVFILNRYFNRMVNVIESYGGRIDNYIGDGLIALFGINNEDNSAVSAVQSAIEMCSEMDEMKPYLKTMYGDAFDIGIGVHYGEAVVGDIGSGRSKRLTAIGDAVNFASRVESANKDFRSRLLISEETHEVVKEAVKIKDFVRTNIKGVEDRVTLYEVEDVHAEVGKVEKNEFMENGLMWRRVNSVSSFDEEPQQVIKVKRDKFLVAKCNDEFVAMNDQCPHAFLSLKGSEIEPDANAIKCRWHNSSFCTRTGDIKSWVNDGMFRFMSKLDSRAKELVEMEQKTLDLFTTKVIDNTVWVGIDPEY